jgi:UDP-N-acetylglucosamine 4-epimerase
MKHESPVINGDGSYSRDFTYIDNVLEMNIRAIVSDNPEAINTVYNVAYGERTDLNELVGLLKDYLSKFDAEITNVNAEYGPNRQGDVPHSLASIEKAKNLLGYDPQFDIKRGLKEAVTWYWQNLK